MEAIEDLPTYRRARSSRRVCPRNRHAILVAQFKSYHITYVIHSSDVIKLYAQNRKILRRTV